MNLALAMVPYLTHGEVLSGSALSGSVPPYRLQGPGANYTPDDAHTTNVRGIPAKTGAANTGSYVDGSQSATVISSCKFVCKLWWCYDLG
jgi:hypothetical protein